MKNAIFLFLLIVLTLVAAIAHGDEIVLELPIQSVTVYPESAIINRVSDVEFPAGSHRLNIVGLPRDFDHERLQINIASSAIKLGSLEVISKQEPLLSDTERQAYERRIQDIQYEIDRVEDDVQTATTQLNLLTKLSEPSVNDVSVDRAQALFDLIGNNAPQAKEKIRGAKRELRVLQRRLSEQQRELQEKSGNRYSRELHLHVEVSRAQKTAMGISYPIEEAAWEWLYEARLDTDKGELILERQAMVSQWSENDWEEIELRISTANPHRSVSRPEINPLYVALSDVSDRRSQGGRTAQNRITTLGGDVVEEIVVTGSYLQENRRGSATIESAPIEALSVDQLSEVGSPGVNELVRSLGAATKARAEVLSERYMADYKITGLVSVARDEAEKILPVIKESFPVNLALVSVPAVELAVFLEARFEYSASIPLEKAATHLYRDGVYIGQATIDTLLPGESAAIAFGVDDRVRIEQFIEPAQSREGSALRDSVTESRLRYEVTNYTDSDIEVEILARIPVVNESGIDVVFADTATEISEDAVDGLSGIVMWKLDLAPKQVGMVNHHLDIRYPRNRALVFVD